MTKGEMRDSVKNALRRIDSTARYHDMVVDKAIEHSMNQYLYDIYRQDPRTLDQYIREYGTYVPIAVEENPATEEYYSTIPAPYVVFPDKQSGVRYVIGHDNDQCHLYPMSIQERILAHNTYIGASSPAEDPGTNVRSFYIVRGNKIIYYRLNEPLFDDGVRVGLVIPFSEYADDEDVNVPFGQNDKIFMTVLQKLSAIPPTDLKDDNKDTQ